MSALNAPLSLRRSPLAVAIGLACLMAHPVWAATLGPNESATVRAGETAETWFLSQRSQLTIGPGAETLQVYASNNSEVVVFGGKATSLNNEAAISLVNSRASIGNAELDSRTIGLSVSSTWLDPGMPSSAMVQDSRVTGGGAGALVDSGTLTVSRSEFSGGGVGIEMADGVLHVADDSIVRGDIGIDLLAAYFFARDLGNQVTIDDSHVQGVGGSAIVVRAENPNDPGKVTQAEIIVRNGSTLTASNGVLVDAEAGANVGLTIDNSHLTGQLINLDRLGLANGARWTLTDHAQVGALSLDRSTIALGGGGGDFRVLEVDSLDGQGRFELGVDLAAHQGDLLKVQGRAEGEHELKIANSGQEPLAGDAPQNVVQTGVARPSSRCWAVRWKRAPMPMSWHVRVTTGHWCSAGMSEAGRCVRRRPMPCSVCTTPRRWPGTASWRACAVASTSCAATATAAASGCAPKALAIR
jgi:hypothetical protein